MKRATLPSKSSLRCSPVFRSEGRRKLIDRGGSRKAAANKALLPELKRLADAAIDAAGRDPDVAAVFKKLHTDTTAAYREVLVRAQQRGDFGKEIKVSDLFAMTVGALFYNRWYSREPLTDRYVE